MNKKIIITAFIILIAIISRLIFLDLRPLHHDEGVNYFFANNVLEGRGFNYDPINYHGPSYFFILFFSFLSLGINEFSLRLPAALFGIILISMPLFFKERTSNNKYMLALFLLFSPSLLFYSRYSIHESLFVLLSFLAVYLLTRIIEMKSLFYLPMLSIVAALLFTTKETVIILGFIVVMICIANYKEIRKINWSNRNNILISIFFFLLVYIAFFSSFFTNISGLIDSFKSYFPWVERGLTEKGHDKPFLYYFFLLSKYELPLLLFSAFGFVYSYKKKSVFTKNVSIWLILVFLIYSLIGYKTPWLIINITVPLCIMASFGIIWISNNIKFPYLILGIGIFYLAMFSFYFNFVDTWQNNPYAYVHTDVDILNLIKELDYNYKSGEKVLIASDIYWPLPFYLNNKEVEYFDKTEKVEFNDNYDYYIVKDKIFAASILPSEYKYKKYRLREEEIIYLVY